MDFRILGPIEVADDQGVVVPITAARERALLALLLLSPNQAVPIGRLVEALWSDLDHDAAIASLQVHVARLRKRIGGASRVVTRAPGYLIVLDDEECDAARFTRHCVTARRVLSAGDAKAAAASWRAGLELWRGNPLGELADHPWAEVESRALEEQRRVATEDWIEAELACGRHAEWLGRLDQLTAEHPLRERLWAARMLALYRAGRQADALRAAQQLRSRLRDELGVDPAPEIVALEHAILEHDPALAGPTAPKPTQARPDVLSTAVRHNLPERRTSFVGRVEETDKLLADLAQARLVTIVGTGGVGKTRLAEKVALSVGASFPDGVWLVELAPLSDGGLVPEVVGAAVGIRVGATTDFTRSLVEGLSDRRLLIVLDNCEHVVGACAEIVDAVLAGCPGVAVLATSREPLGVTGERVHRIGPLDERAGVDLLVDRISATRAGFSPGDEELDALASLHHRLDGLPLALELAAVRMRALSPRELSSRIHDHFRLLHDDQARLPARHRTLLTVIEWSHDLLSPPEQVLFRRLAVFAGTFSLSGAEEVAADDYLEAGDVVDLMTSLIDKSLVQTHLGAATRYEMLQTVRSFAAARLEGSGDGPGLRARLLRWAVTLAERADEEFEGPDQIAWFNLIQAEHPNLVAVLSDRADPGQAEDRLKVAGRLSTFWFVRGRPEAEALLEQALRDAPQARPHVRLRGWVALGHVCKARDLHKSLAAFGQAIEVGSPLGPSRDLAFALAQVGDVLWRVDERERALVALEKAEAMADELGDELSRLRVDGFLGNFWFGHDDQRSRTYYTRSLPLTRVRGRARYVAGSLINVAQLELRAGNFDRAKAMAAESGAMYVHIGEHVNLPEALLTEAIADLRLGREADSQARAVEALSLLKLTGHSHAARPALQILAHVAMNRGDAERAALLLGAAERGQRIQFELDTAGVTSQARRQLGDQAFAAAFAAGQSLTHREACDLAASGPETRLSFSPP